MSMLLESKKLASTLAYIDRFLTDGFFRPLVASALGPWRGCSPVFLGRDAGDMLSSTNSHSCFVQQQSYVYVCVYAVKQHHCFKEKKIPDERPTHSPQVFLEVVCPDPAKHCLPFVCISIG